jgi:hypothetical protein
VTDTDRPSTAEIVFANPNIPWYEPLPMFACRICCVTGEGGATWISTDREKIIEHLREYHGLASFQPPPGDNGHAES